MHVHSATASTPPTPPPWSHYGKRPHTTNDDDIMDDKDHYQDDIIQVPRPDPYAAKPIQYAFPSQGQAEQARARL
jgi:hypothetical protein